MSLQELELLCGLHPLGNHLQPQIARQTDDRLHDHRVITIHHHVTYEGVVDLQRIDRQALQLGEAGEALAKVIDRRLHAVLAQEVQRGRGLQRIRDHRGFRHLDHQRAARQAIVPQLRQYLGRQIDSLQLHRGQIYRQLRRIAATHPPLGHLPAGLAHHPGPDVVDQSVLLSERDEDIGRNESALGVPPPDQGFGAHGAASLQLLLGLIVQFQLLLRDGLSQLAL